MPQQMAWFSLQKWITNSSVGRSIDGLSLISLLPKFWLCCFYQSSTAISWEDPCKAKPQLHTHSHLSPPLQTPSQSSVELVLFSTAVSNKPNFVLSTDCLVILGNWNLTMIYLLLLQKVGSKKAHHKEISYNLNKLKVLLKWKLTTEWMISWSGLLNE